jgi:hypothetical protein
MSTLGGGGGGTTTCGAHVLAWLPENRRRLPHIAALLCAPAQESMNSHRPEQEQRHRENIRERRQKR